MLHIDFLFSRWEEGVYIKSGTRNEPTTSTKLENSSYSRYIFWL
ncbi:hypothetical protein VCHA36P161_10074 [Vibrio chagasii]|nr:hypothetical protein VCHA36P161_10074 [Vibrio chagasii]CAH6909165.1 hypothetical protein VCHA35P150_20518 [Vibrio chagasii]CAH6996390.1 hypothetical protein VCHA37O173_50231 [Vibrio chagasii]